MCVCAFQFSKLGKFEEENMNHSSQNKYFDVWFQFSHDMPFCHMYAMAIRAGKMMWQSWIELKYYSVTYFEHITRGGACTRFIDMSDIHMFYIARMSPSFSGSSAL